MGLKPSLYQTTQAMLFAEDVIQEDPSNEDNIFNSDNARLKLPGSEGVQGQTKRDASRQFLFLHG
jgi:hypothetical protein